MSVCAAISCPTGVITYAGCDNVNRIQVSVAGQLFDFSQFARIRFFLRNLTDFNITIIDSIDNPGSISVASAGVLDLVFGLILTTGSYDAGLKVFINSGDTIGQMIFHDQQRLLQFQVLNGTPQNP